MAVKSRAIKRSLPLALLLPQQLPGGFPGCRRKLKCCRPSTLTSFPTRLSSYCRGAAPRGPNIFMVVRSMTGTIHRLLCLLLLFVSPFFPFCQQLPCQSSFSPLPPLSPISSSVCQFRFHFSPPERMDSCRGVAFRESRSPIAVTPLGLEKINPTN